MNPTLAQDTIESLRGLTAQEADQRLCAMHSETWQAIADVFGLRLPTVGGDKPAILGFVLLAKGIIRA